MWINHEQVEQLLLGAKLVKNSQNKGGSFFDDNIQQIIIFRNAEGKKSSLILYKDETVRHVDPVQYTNISEYPTEIIYWTRFTVTILVDEQDEHLTICITDLLTNYRVIGKYFENLFIATTATKISESKYALLLHEINTHLAVELTEITSCETCTLYNDYVTTGRCCQFSTIPFTSFEKHYDETI